MVFHKYIVWVHYRYEGWSPYDFETKEQALEYMKELANKEDSFLLDWQLTQVEEV